MQELTVKTGWRETISTISSLITTGVLIFIMFSGSFLSCGKTAASSRIDKIEYKALENFANIKPIMSLIEKGDKYAASELYCMLQQVLKGSDQNLCASKVKQIDKERSVEMRKKIIMFCYQRTKPYYIEEMHKDKKTKKPRLIIKKYNPVLDNWTYQNCIDNFKNF